MLQCCANSFIKKCQRHHCNRTLIVGYYVLCVISHSFYYEKKNNEQCNACYSTRSREIVVIMTDYPVAYPITCKCVRSYHLSSTMYASTLSSSVYSSENNKSLRISMTFVWMKLYDEY